MTDLPEFFTLSAPWEKMKNSIWLTSTLTLHRNIRQFPFPSKLGDKDAEKLLVLLKDTLFSVKKLQEPLYLKAPETSALDKEFLFEHFFCLEGFQNTQDGEAFIIDHSAEALILFCIQDHLQLQLVDYNGELDNSWKKIADIESGLAKTLPMAFSQKFGYHTADIGQCGTALMAKAFLHVPALIHTKKLPDFLLNQEESIASTGMEGLVDDLLGDIIVLFNKYTIGITEQSILSALSSVALKLMTEEKAARARLKENPQIVIKDEVSRALGLLMNAKQLQTKEALNALSLLRLGVDLGWVASLSGEKLNELFFRARRAHLAYALKEKAMDLQQLAQKRAEFIQKEIQGARIL